MLVDPGIEMAARAGPKGFYGYEVADAVEETSFKLSGIEISNFVYPSWFESFHANGSTQFDYLGKCTAPFELLPGGYIQHFRKRQLDAVVRLGKRPRRSSPSARTRGPSCEPRRMS